MADETEEIEARLCAYMDGELDEAARAEIGRHLESNPRHRQLIQEMERGRRLLQSLPRESAPPEIEESMHTHLERSVLLDDGPGGAAPLRMNRRPQFMAVAAIVLLAVGLGLVVWLVVRPPVASHPTAVNLQQEHLAVAPPGEVRMETSPMAATAPAAANDADVSHEAATRPMYSMADGQAALSKTAERSKMVAAPLASTRPAEAMRAPRIQQVMAEGMIGLWATTEDAPQTDLGLRAFINMQGLKAEVINMTSLPQWVMCRSLRVVIVQGMDAKQLQSLRQWLDTTARVTVIPLTPMPATRPADGPSADLVRVAIVVDAQSHDLEVRPPAAVPAIPDMQESTPASQPTTMPAVPYEQDMDAQP